MSQQARRPMTFSRADAPSAPPAPPPQASNDPTPPSNLATKVAADRQQLGARVSKDLYRQFKVYAAQTGGKMDAMVEEAMREYLARRVAS